MNEVVKVAGPVPADVEGEAAAAGVTQRTEVSIIWNADGSLSVTGPLENEMLFDWLLKKAGESAAQWRRDQPKKTLKGRLHVITDKARALGKRIGRR